MNTVNVSYCGRETAGRRTVPGAKGIHHFVESLRASPASPLYASVYRYLSLSESDRLRLLLHIQEDFCKHGLSPLAYAAQGTTPLGIPWPGARVETQTNTNTCAPPKVEIHRFVVPLHGPGC